MSGHGGARRCCVVQLTIVDKIDDQDTVVWRVGICGNDLYVVAGGRSADLDPNLVYDSRSQIGYRCRYDGMIYDVCSVTIRTPSPLVWLVFGLLSRKYLQSRRYQARSSASPVPTAEYRR